MIPLRTGIDLVEVKRIHQVNEAIRVRFMRRIFTPQELADFESSPGSLAGRFAAKEAVAKALGTGIGEIAWQDIEVLRGPRGEPRLSLHGKAGVLAGDLGLTTWSLSISHTQTHAVAVAVAAGDPIK